jgi:glycosyltransferase involved in cell wall biosynthesis
MRKEHILYVGRIHPEKGLHLLIEAAISQKDLMEGWRIVVVGPSETRLGGGGQHYLEQLKRLSEPIRDRIDWVGPVFDSVQLAEHYRTASLFVYPSLADTGEALPLAPLEAMSNGCLVLVSKLECFRDYLEDGVTGFTFDHAGANPHLDLARVISEILKGEERTSRVRQAGWMRSREFSLEAIADDYLRDFSSLLGSSGGFQQTAYPEILKPCDAGENEVPVTRYEWKSDNQVDQPARPERLL